MGERSGRNTQVPKPSAKKMHEAVNADLPHRFLPAVPASLNKLRLWVFYTQIYPSAPFAWVSAFGSKGPPVTTAQITSHNLCTLLLCSRGTWRGAGTPARPRFDTAAGNFSLGLVWELQPGLDQAKCSTSLASRL